MSLSLAAYKTRYTCIHTGRHKKKIKIKLKSQKRIFFQLHSFVYIIQYVLHGGYNCTCLLLLLRCWFGMLDSILFTINKHFRFLLLTFGIFHFDVECCWLGFFRSQFDCKAVCLICTSTSYFFPFLSPFFWQICWMAVPNRKVF